MLVQYNVLADGSMDKSCSSNDRVSLKRTVPTAGTKNISPMYENTTDKKVVHCCQLREISITIIIELLSDSKDSEMYEACVVGVLGRVRVVRPPGNGLLHGWD
jgi:hypothetical protein